MTASPTAAKLKRIQFASAQCRTHGCAAKLKWTHSKSALRAIRISLVSHPSVCFLHLAVISEAMLRLGSLLRTDHMLGGAQSDTLFKHLHHVLEELSDE